MKKFIKIFVVLLLFAVNSLVCSQESKVSAASINTSSQSLSFNLDQESVSDSVYAIQNHLDVPGNMVVFTANDINKLSLYENILKPLHIPLFLEDNEFKQISPDAILSQKEEKINGEKNIVVPTKTTLVALYNANGKITVLQNDEPINSSASVQRFLNHPENTEQSIIDDFRDDMNKLVSTKKSESMSISAANDQGDILTSIRKTFTVNGTYTGIGGTKNNYVAGKAVTDYIIYSNTTGSHFYVLADSQISPAGVASTNNAVWTTGYKSNIRTNSTTNSLISWSPDSSALKLNSDTKFTVGVSASATGLQLSFTYSWSGAASANLQSTGSKTSGLTTEYFYKDDGKGLATSMFKTGHGALIKATNKVLSFSASHQFRNDNVYSNSNTWYSTNSTNLSYSFN